MQPIIAVVCDVREFDNYRWHAAPETYLRAALEVAGVMPVLVPAFGEKIDIASLLGRVDGVMLTGSKTNVHPSFFGVEPTADHEPFDMARDGTSLPMARAAVAGGVPLLAICRGHQELNVAMGGTLATEIQNLEGRNDHRSDPDGSMDHRFRIVHNVTPRAGGSLAEIVGEAPVPVNSLHRQAVDQLAPGLMVEALADDGTIEAYSVAGARAFALGVQWHPEYWAGRDGPSTRIFQAFGDAVHAYASGRLIAAQ